MLQSIKYPTAPKACCYTTLWNTGMQNPHRLQSQQRQIMHARIEENMTVVDNIKSNKKLSYGLETGRQQRISL